MKPLYEANASTIISKNMHDKMFKKACEALLYKGYDVSRIPDSVIKKMTPEEAFKLKGKKGDLYFKFWFDKQDKFAFCTWANTMIDSRFRWKHSERSFPIGDYTWVNRYMDTNDTIFSLGYAYVIAFDDMPKNEALRQERKDAKLGAIALMSDDQIRKTNFERYQEIIQKNNFSDGSEFAFIDNAIKPIKIKAFNQYSPFMTLYKWRDISVDISDYLSYLMQIIQMFRNGGYDFTQTPKDWEYPYFIDNVKKSFSNILLGCNKMFNSDYYRKVLKFYKTFISVDITEIDKFEKDVIELVGNDTELVKFITKYYVPALKYIFEMIEIVNKSLIKTINGISKPSKLTIAKIEILNDSCKKISDILYDNRVPDMLDMFYLWYTKQIKITDVLSNRSTVRLVMDHRLDKIQIYCKMLEALV